MVHKLILSIRRSTVADAAPSFIIEPLEPRMVLSAATALEPMAPHETRSLTFDATSAPVAAPVDSGWNVSARETSQSQSGGPAPEATNALDDLDVTLTALLDAWQHGPQAGTQDLAEVIQAVRTLQNANLTGVQAATPGLFDGIKQVADSLDDKLSGVEGPTGTIQTVRDTLDSIDPLVEGKKMEDVRKVFGALGQAADELSMAMDQLGADQIADAKNVLAVLEPFTHSGETLNAAETARKLAEVLRAGNGLNPLPGVSDMIDTYADAVDAFAGAMQTILNQNSNANLIMYAGHPIEGRPAGGTPNPFSPLGNLWAEQVLNNPDYRDYIPTDNPFTDWPSGQVPQGVYPTVN